MNRLFISPLEFVFQEQSYSSPYCGRSSPLDHFRGDIAKTSGIIADFCRVIADPCGVVAISDAIGGYAVADAAMPIVARITKHHKTLLFDHRNL